MATFGTAAPLSERTKTVMRGWSGTQEYAPCTRNHSMAVGNRTFEVAKQFGVTDCRISQLRRELAASWKKFVGDEPATPAA